MISAAYCGTYKAGKNGIFNGLLKCAISFLLLCLPFMVGALPAFSFDYDDLVSIPQLEKKVFGEIRNQASLQDRLVALEIQIWHQKQDGSEHKRVSALLATVLPGSAIATPNSTAAIEQDKSSFVPQRSEKPRNFGKNKIALGSADRPKRNHTNTAKADHSESEVTSNEHANASTEASQNPKERLDKTQADSPTPVSEKRDAQVRVPLNECQVDTQPTQALAPQRAAVSDSDFSAALTTKPSAPPAAQKTDRTTKTGYSPWALLLGAYLVSYLLLALLLWQSNEFTKNKKQILLFMQIVFPGIGFLAVGARLKGVTAGLLFLMLLLAFLGSSWSGDLVNIIEQTGYKIRYNQLLIDLVKDNRFQVQLFLLIALMLVMYRAQADLASLLRLSVSRFSRFRDSLLLSDGIHISEVLHLSIAVILLWIFAVIVIPPKKKVQITHIEILSAKAASASVEKHSASVQKLRSEAKPINQKQSQIDSKADSSMHPKEQSAPRLSQVQKTLPLQKDAKANSARPIPVQQEQTATIVSKFAESGKTIRRQILTANSANNVKAASLQAAQVNRRAVDEGRNGNVTDLNEKALLYFEKGKAKEALALLESGKKPENLGEYYLAKARIRSNTPHSWSNCKAVGFQKFSIMSLKNNAECIRIRKLDCPEYADIKKALEINPNKAEVIWLDTVINYACDPGRYPNQDNVERGCNLALSKDPNCWQALYSKAVNIHFSLYWNPETRLDESILLLDKVLELNPNCGNAYAYRAFFKARKGGAGVESDLNVALSLMPKSALAHHLKGYFYLSKQKYKQAESEFSIAISNSDNIQNWMRYHLAMNRAYSRVMQDKTDLALEDIRLGNKLGREFLAISDTGFISEEYAYCKNPNDWLEVGFMPYYLDPSSMATPTETDPFIPGGAAVPPWPGIR